jgi:hypothetical protein
MWFDTPASSGRIVTEDQFKLLVQCVLPRTIEEHAKIIAANIRHNHGLRHLRRKGAILSRFAAFSASTLSETSLFERSFIELIEAQLRSLVAEGLLKSVCRSTDSPDCREHDKISTIGIVTHNRPLALDRAIRSYLGAARYFGRRSRVYVVDGSSDANARDQITTILCRAAAELGAEAVYFGLEEGLKLIRLLSNVAPEDLLAFCLTGLDGVWPQTGANRNRLLLGTLDETILSVDDDTTTDCSAASSFETDSVRFTSTGEVQEFDFDSPDRPITQTLTNLPNDSLSMHEGLTGRSLTDVIWQHQWKVEYAPPVSPLLAWALRRPEQFRVAITISGVVGHSGTYSPSSLLELKGTSLSNLLRSKEGFSNAILSDQLIRRPVSTTITDSPWCMTTAYSINQSIVSAPFLPVFRNQDGLFGRICRYCFPNALFAHTKSLVRHQRVGKFERPALIVGISAIRMVDLIASCLPAERSSVWAESVEHGRVSMLGGHLRTLARLKDPDLIDYFVQKARMILYERYNRWLELSTDKYQYLSDDVSSALRELVSAMASPECWIPRDLPGHIRKEECIQFVKFLLNQFGMLLEYWPAIVEATRILRLKGYTAGTRVA